MKRFAKITAVLAAMVLALAFIGCSSGDDDDEPEKKFVTFTTADGKNVLKVYGLGEGNEGEYELTLDGAEKPSEGTWKAENETTVSFTTDNGSLTGTITSNTNGEVTTITCKIDATEYTFLRDGNNADEVPSAGDDAFDTFKTEDGKNILKVFGIKEGEGRYELTFDGQNSSGTWNLSGTAGTIYITPNGSIPTIGTIELDNASGEVTSISFKIEGKDYTFTPAN